MADATAKFLSALSASGYKVRGYGRDRWRAQCPGHKGEDLNLSVAKGDQGVLIRCFSHDCSEVEIAAGVGLDVRDLFDEGGEARYDYGGGHTVIRRRTPAGKTITQVGSPTGPTRLYLPAGSKRIEDSSIVVLGEGEKTVDALVRLGIECAATWPGGSGAVSKVDLTPLTGKHVKICPDNDGPGQKAAEKLRERLQGTASRVTILRVPLEYQGASLNDAADLLLAGGSAEDLVGIDPKMEEAIDNERFYIQVRDEARRREAADRAAQVSTKLNPKPLDEILAQRVSYDWIIPDLLERGDRLVLTGTEGLGKSWLLRMMSLSAAAGIDPFRPDRRYDPRNVLVIDAENTESQWARGVKYLSWIVSQYGHGNVGKKVSLSAGVRVDLTQRPDANQIHQLIDEHKPDVLYIGPLYKLVPRAVMTDDDAAPLIATLDEFRERGLTLLMEAHAGHAKGAGGDRDLRPRGSSALLGWPEFGYGLQRDEESENMAHLIPWRGQREERRWPRLLRRGNQDYAEMPWVAEE